MRRTAITVSLLVSVGCVSPAPDPDAERALALAQSGDCAAAFSLALAGANQGDARSQSALGSFYLDGLLLEPDYDEARRWLEKAAAQGDASGQYLLGLLYSWGAGVPGSQVRAVYWWSRSAQAGYADAQFDLAWRLLTGRGTEKNHGMAVFWLRAAAVQGHGLARPFLEKAVRRGPNGRYSVPRIDVLKDAAALDDVAAQWKLAQLYLDDPSGPANRDKASFLIREAAANGHPDAARYLSENRSALMTRSQLRCERIEKRD